MTAFALNRQGASLPEPRVNREFYCHDVRRMKICIVSDSHDRAPQLAAAVAVAKQAGAQAASTAATWLLVDLASFDFEIRRLD